MVHEDVAVVCYGNHDFIKSLQAELYGKFNENIVIPLDVKKFADGEIYPKIKKNIRRKRVYFVANFEGYDGSFDPNIGYIRVFLINDAIKRSSAEEINNVLPFIPYIRQERKTEPRVPISARLFADLLEQSGATRLTTIDMHTGAAQGFYTIPVDDFPAIQVIGDELATGNYGVNEEDWVIVSPDAGAMGRAKTFKEYLREKHEIDLRIAMTEKTRGKEGEPEVQYVVGDVDGKNVWMPDDMVDSADTLCESWGKLKDKGAKKVVASSTHGLFSIKKDRRAEDRLREAEIFVVSTDTIPRSPEYREENSDWLKIVSTTPIISEAIHRIDTGGSLSELYPNSV